MASNLWPTIEDRRVAAQDFLNLLGKAEELARGLLAAKDAFTTMDNPYDLGAYAALISIAEQKLKAINADVGAFLEEIQAKIDQG